MSVGGYGPVQYYVLTSQALALSPRVLVIGLFLGNDIYDAYRTAYFLSAHRELRASTAGADLAQQDTIAERSGQLLEGERRHSNSFGTSPPSLWPLWLRGHSAVGRLLDANLTQWGSGQGFWHHAERSWALAHPDVGTAWNGRAPTVLRTAYRLLALDLDEPRIAEGLRITKEILQRIHFYAQERGARTVVLLLPTKETVYAELIGMHGGGLSSSYQRLVVMESRVHDELDAFLVDHRIERVDALAVLREAVAQGQRVFPATTDGHLTEEGYLIIATLLNRSLEQGLPPRHCRTLG
jgi:hypothetical protein